MTTLRLWMANGGDLSFDELSADEAQGLVQQIRNGTQRLGPLWITLVPSTGTRTSINVNHVVSMDLPDGVD